jgi:hypothetical protein
VAGLDNRDRDLLGGNLFSNGFDLCHRQIAPVVDVVLDGETLQQVDRPSDVIRVLMRNPHHVDRRSRGVTAIHA